MIIQKPEFNLEHQYAELLQHLGYKSEAQLSEPQKTVMRHVFYGTCSRLLYLMTGEMADIENEDDGADTLQDMLEQVNAYWEVEMKRLEKIKKT